MKIRKPHKNYSLKIQILILFCLLSIGAIQYITLNQAKIVSSQSLQFDAKPVRAKIDRANRFSVKDFGAKGNGIADDTKAIQTAVNKVYAQGGGILVFPPGVYVVTSVKLKENISYEGYGATIKRPKNQGKWTRTFIAEYSGLTDSKPLIIKGFTFDGNSKNQGNYNNYELEQAHLLFLTADPSYPGRLRAFIEDCFFKNGVADGISVYTNVFVKVNKCEAADIFRGGFVLTGGNSFVEVNNFTTRGKVDAAGIDIEVDGRGYGNTLKVDVKLQNLNLINGRFDIGVADDSRVIGNNIVSNDAPFVIYSLKSKMKFTNSKFKVGASDGYINRILFPHNVTFENCEFYVTRKETENPYQFFSAADVWWQHPSQAIQRNQLLIFKDCVFKIDSNMKKNDTTYAVYVRKDLPWTNNNLVITGGHIDKKFKSQIVKE